MSSLILPLFALISAQQDVAQPIGAEPLASSESEDPRPDPKERMVSAKIGADEAAIATGLNRFGFDIYGEMRSQRGDLVVSPASISTAFGLAYAGARGATAEQIAKTLRYPRVADFHRSFGRLLDTMQLHQNGRP